MIGNVSEGTSFDIDWKAFKVEAAKDFLAAIITRDAPQYDFGCRNVLGRVEEAIIWAEALTEQLKKRDD